LEPEWTRRARRLRQALMGVRDGGSSSQPTP
jgi:hypothetical protein